MRINQRKTNIENLYEASMELFLTKGYEGTLMDEIAERAGYKSRSSVYALVKSKEQIFEDLIFIVLHHFVDSVDELEQSNKKPKEKIQALLELFVSTKCEMPKQTELAIDQWRFLGGEKKKEFVEKRQKLIAFIESNLSLGKEEGVFEFNDLTMATRLILHSIRWVDDKARLKEAKKNRHAIASNLLDLVFRAISPSSMTVLKSQQGS